MITGYTVPEIWHVMNVIVICHFGLLFPFLPTTPHPTLTARKMKIQKKKRKKSLEISSFYTCVPKLMIICYTIPEIWCVTDVIVVFHFGLLFSLLPRNSPKNQNFKNMKKMPGDIIILHMYTKTYD